MRIPAIFLAAMTAAGGTGVPRQDGDAVRILFIGNSYTEFHNLTGLVKAFLEAGGRQARIGKFTAGGATLRDHWNHNEGTTPDPRRANRKGGLDRLLDEQGPWDFVVLQGQSQETLAGLPCAFDQYAARLVEKVRKSQPGAKPVFYMTWARQHIPAQQAEITKTYLDAARANRGLVAPVGEAWKAALAARPGLVLHEADRSHPNVRGCYLAACVFAAVLTGESPVGLPARVESLRAGEKLLYDLPADEARFLQETAWEAVRRFRADAGAPAPK